ncbi:glycerate kinase [Angustibacter aerolatus]
MLAPDAFKGTMSADVVARALAEGVAEAGGEPVRCPLADGGEGTAEVLRAALGGDLVEVVATGPLGDPVPASFVLAADGTAVVETATASGLHLVHPGPGTAEAATTTGTGELLVAAARAGAQRILLGVGGSATTDGGLGALQAVRAGGGQLGAHLTVLCDVRTPYERAAEVYGPQKGADAETVARLTSRLLATAAWLPRDPRGRPMTGAAGGLSGALWADLGAELVPGVPAVLDAVGFDALLGGADLVLTGEGRLDAQTAEGKVVAGVARRAAAKGVPVHAVVGRCDLDDAGLAVLGLAGAVEAGDPGALRSAARTLTSARRRALSRRDAPSG